MGLTCYEARAFVTGESVTDIIRAARRGSRLYIRLIRGPLINLPELINHKLIKRTKRSTVYSQPTHERTQHTQQLSHEHVSTSLFIPRI